MKKYFEASNRGLNTRLEISKATACQNFAAQNVEGQLNFSQIEIAMQNLLNIVLVQRCNYDLKLDSGKA